MRRLFIADIHLRPDAPARTDALCAFLARQRGAVDGLYVLGDLFDLWVGDDADLDDWGPVTGALADLAGAGTAVYLMEGNHDFLIGADFHARAGSRPLPDPGVLDLDGRRAVLSHGDALCTDDLDYQAFRAHIRAPHTLAQLRALPVAERRRVGAQLRAQSAIETRHKRAAMMDVNAAAARALLAAHDASCLIHGHTHRPGVTPLDDAGRARITLGAWQAGVSALWWHGGEPRAVGIPGIAAPAPD